MNHPALRLLVVLLLVAIGTGFSPSPQQNRSAGDDNSATIVLRSKNLASLEGPQKESLAIDGLFYETSKGRVMLPPQFTLRPHKSINKRDRMPDGRFVTLSVRPAGSDFAIRLSAKPDLDIVRWGLAISAGSD